MYIFYLVYRFIFYRTWLAVPLVSICFFEIERRSRGTQPTTRQRCRLQRSISRTRIVSFYNYYVCNTLSIQ